MAENFEKIIDLIKKTGDNCVVLDPSGNPAYVVVTFKDYRDLVLNKSEVAGLTEDQLLDKINRDIATWKATQESENFDNWQAIESAVEELKGPAAGLEEEEKPLKLANNDEEDETAEKRYYFEPID